MAQVVRQEITEYSERVEGDHWNWEKTVRFDATDGYIGITSFDDDGHVIQRVLLTPKQIKALIRFTGTTSLRRRK